MDRPRRRIRHPRLAVTALVLLSLAGAPAWAWSGLGHRIVDTLAEAALSPAARAEVQRLLEGEADPSLAGIADWPDRIRDQERWKHTAPWHYLNFPPDADCAYREGRDCRGGDCLVGATQRQLAVLRDRSASREQRAQALKFVVHFVGDLHQPLHAGFGHDKGGNDFQVSLRLPERDTAEGTNLHGLWDWWLLSSREDDAAAYAALLGAAGLPTSERDEASAQPVVDWAEESCRIVREPGFYPQRHRLDADYLERWRPTAEKRLREAAGRLAWLLEDALG